ncbi:hypothetical protein RCL1_001927 [Eukaryota sp. TZLM3-RCL]
MQSILLITLSLLALCSASRFVGLYYFSQWPDVNIHYRKNGDSDWTPVPGVKMLKSTHPSFSGWYYFQIETTGLEFVLNSNGQWDNNGGKNYLIREPGPFALKNGALSSLGNVCEHDCGHGKCIDGMCICDSTSYGYDCLILCPTFDGKICDGNGKCAFDGSCSCNDGYGGCDASTPRCNVNFSNSTLHCGKCNSPCSANPSKGILNAQCNKGICSITCTTGLTPCPDQTCREKCPTPPLPGCEIYRENQCSGKQAHTDPKYAAHAWQTYKNTSTKYLASYEGLSEITGYPAISYEQGKKAATITVHVFKQNEKDTVFVCFDGSCSTSSTLRLTSDYKKELLVSIKSQLTGAIVTFDPLHFIWNVAPLKERRGDYRSGQKGAIVELFGWPYEDIEKECEFIGQAGYLGVKVFPPTEQLMSYQPFNDVLNPWYFMYQPVSYRFHGRWGSRDQLKAMISKCRSHGVRVYFDAVVNHLTGSGNDILDHRNPSAGCTTWSNKTSTGALYGKQSPFFTQGWTYQPNENTGLAPQQEFPRVPYFPTNFHCEKSLNSWTDGFILNTGWLSGLVDLDTSQDYVRQRIADYFIEALSLGFSGLRVDAAKHIVNTDLVAIFSKVAKGMGGSLPDDFIAYLEVLFGGELALLLCDDSSDYSYGRPFARQLLDAGLSPEDVKKIKIWDSAYPVQPAGSCVFDMMDRLVAQNDDHDQQMPGSSSRDMHDQGCVLIKGCDASTHRSFEQKLFLNPNGVTDNDNQYPIRLVLSSFYWMNESFGIPDGLSDCKHCKLSCQSCRSVPKIQAFRDDSRGYDKDYTRVHRDAEVVRAMKTWMKI